MACNTSLKRCLNAMQSSILLEAKKENCFLVRLMGPFLLVSQIKLILHLNAKHLNFIIKVFSYVNEAIFMIYVFHFIL